MNIYDILKELDIRYEEIEHKNSIYTAKWFNQISRAYQTSIYFILKL